MIFSLFCNFVFIVDRNDGRSQIVMWGLLDLFFYWRLSLIKLYPQDLMKSIFSCQYLLSCRPVKGRAPRLAQQHPIWQTRQLHQGLSQQRDARAVLHAGAAAARRRRLAPLHARNHLHRRPRQERELIHVYR